MRPDVGSLNHPPIPTVNMHELLLADGQTHTPSSPPISIPAVDLCQTLSPHLLIPTSPRRTSYFN
ncbi:hypothetical protein GALMADRAFT_147942 [Galerina marginata CBS 339.88]|uniref:Uncharacterized protein n=1 Tax=Galerina marginata (strain CBS 339.88) TaxID=685588 RepID=A0A067S8U1_GALM3|nr:hypothetical protein GALMADRAFT_147942 [Galerina marginata CBS 339.88]